MKQLALLVSLAVTWHFGCAGKSLSSTSDGGATTATGGNSGAVLTVGAGTGANSGCSSDGYYGAGTLDGGLPDAGIGIPTNACGAVPDDISTFPWDLAPASTNVGAGGAVGAVGAGGASGAAASEGAGVASGGTGGVDGGLGGGSGVGSGCQTTPKPYGLADVTCSGAAWLRLTGGGWSSSFGGAGGSNVPSIAWDDGSRLLWQAYGPYGTSPPVAPPIGAGAADQRVWVEMEYQLDSQNGVFATIGSPTFDLFTSETMTVRDAQNGSIRFFAQQGIDVPDPGAEQLSALFGVSVSSTPSCSLTAQGSDYAARATVYDHVLETTPPQPIPYAQPTRVTTPNGTFDVLWFTRAQELIYPDCGPGVHQAPMVGFIASRVASP